MSSVSEKHVMSVKTPTKSIFETEREDKYILKGTISITIKQIKLRWILFTVGKTALFVPDKIFEKLHVIIITSVNICEKVQNNKESKKKQRHKSCPLTSAPF